MGNSQSSCLASSAHRRISLSSCTLPLSISSLNRHHPLFPLVPSIAGCCCLFDFLFLLLLSACAIEFVTQQGLSLVSLPSVVAALPATVRSVRQESRVVSLAGGCGALPSCVPSRALLCWRSTTAPPLPSSPLPCLLLMLVILSFSLRSVKPFVPFMNPFSLCVRLHCLPSLPFSVLR